MKTFRLPAALLLAALLAAGCGGGDGEKKDTGPAAGSGTRHATRSRSMR